MWDRSTKFARGTVWWVDVVKDSMCTTSQQGKRPFLIISNDEYNIRYKKVTALPMSHQEKYKNFDSAVCTVFDNKECYILVDQIRQIDFSYLCSYHFTVNGLVMDEVERKFKKLYTSDYFFTDEDNATSENSDTAYKVDSLAEQLNDLNTTLSNIKNFINITNSKVENHNKEIIKIVTTLNDLVLGINNKKAVLDMMADVTISKDTEKKVDSTKVKSNKPKVIGNRNVPHSTSAMPSGFYTDVQNNVDFWNDLLIEGEEFVCKKYNLPDRIRFCKRKSNVRLFLERNGFDTTDIITSTIVKK